MTWLSGASVAPFHVHTLMRLSLPALTTKRPSGENKTSDTRTSPGIVLQSRLFGARCSYSVHFVSDGKPAEPPPCPPVPPPPAPPWPAPPWPAPPWPAPPWPAPPWPA